MARARCQFTVTSESTSGASTSTSRGGTWLPSRQKIRSVGASKSGSSADCQACNSKCSKSRPSSAGSSQPGGTRQTGCFVPAASGVAVLAVSPARWLKTTDLPMFVPPTMATINSGGPCNCGSSLRWRRSNHSRPCGGPTPTRWAAGASTFDRAGQLRDARGKGGKRHATILPAERRHRREARSNPPGG